MGKDNAHYELEMIRRYTSLRGETDQEIPTWLPILGLILGVAGLIMMLSSLLFIPFSGIGSATPPAAAFFLFITGASTALIGIIAGALILLYLVYLWLDRINKHFDRVRNLYRNLALYLEKRGYSDLSRWVDNELREMEYKMSGERSPILWAILVFLFYILIWYVLHMVNDSIRKLGASEHNIIKRLNEELKEKGLSMLGSDIDEIGSVEKRDTILYIILSIVTLGIFTIYWAYVATKDINQHFYAHHKIEDQLLDAIEKL